MSLVHHFKLNETSGSTATDSAGSADGTINGATLGVSGATGVTDTAYSFDGSNDYIEVPDQQVPENLTISCWVNWDGPYATTDDRDMIVSGAFNGTTTEFELFYQDPVNVVVGQA